MPYEFALLPSDHQLSEGIHTIRVVAVDSDGISGEASIEENFIDSTATPQNTPTTQTVDQNNTP
jgi:hypothetical protein